MGALRRMGWVAPLCAAVAAAALAVLALHRPLSSVPPDGHSQAATPAARPVPGAKFARPAPIGAASLDGVRASPSHQRAAPGVSDTGSRAIGSVFGALWPLL